MQFSRTLSECSVIRVNSFTHFFSSSYPPPPNRRSPDYSGGSAESRRCYSLFIFPHFMAHTVNTIDIGVLSVLVGCECSTPVDLSIPLLIFHSLVFGARKSLWREHFLEGGLEKLRECVLTLDAKSDLRKHFQLFDNIYDLFQLDIAASISRQSRKKKLTTKRVQLMLAGKKSKKITIHI